VFFVRAVEAGDLPAVVSVAQHLDSVNLPNDPGRLAQMIDVSERSFAGQLPPAKHELLFVVVERDEAGREQVIGSSMIFAQHGSRQAPHVFFDVRDEERYSESLDRHFRHTVLRIGYNYRGLTEVGGLVLLPRYRGNPAQLGKLLAYVRFLYVALHRDSFCDEVVAELMPPLEPDGRSLLWEAVGRHFTGLSYQEADRLSRENKEFIRTLFPQDPIYGSLLPPAAQALIGQVGPTSKPVERLLRRIGFSYAQRIDPFDGGPHFHARTDDITLVKTARRLRVSAADRSAAATDAFVAREAPEPPFFRAVRAPVRLGDGTAALPEDVATFLGVKGDDLVGLTPLP
jgi:arginine N-succinyltransferase